MTNKRIRPPRKGRVGPEDARFIDETDVEGHAWVNPAPPVEFSKGTPGHGGELFPTDTDDDIEAQRPV